MSQKITNITITCTTDDPNAAPFAVDLNTPGASFFLEHLAREICPNTPAAYPPNAPYDYTPLVAKCLKFFSQQLLLHREGESSANQQVQNAISTYALDEMAQLIDQLTQDETLNWSSTSELPDDFKKRLFELDGLLKAVGTPWKDIVEDFHKRTPMSEARKKELLELVCFPEEFIAWEEHA
jgi:hypothetical protein